MTYITYCTQTISVATQETTSHVGFTQYIVFHWDTAGDFYLFLSLN